MTEDITVPMLINGEPTSGISALDRGLLYGDGVFETIAVDDGRPYYWNRHMRRLQAGCERLGIPPCNQGLLRTEADSLLEAAGKGVIKIVITRGPGGRGYRVSDSVMPTRILQLHPARDYPEAFSVKGIRTISCNARLAHNPKLAGIKHLNRLEQVLARREWDDPDIQEGLLTDNAGNMIEGTMSNLFMVKDDVLKTPLLDQCGVAGIMRTLVLEQAKKENLKTAVCTIHPDELAQSDEVFVCNSVIGIWPVIAMNDQAYVYGPHTASLQQTLVDHNDDSNTWIS